MDISKYYRKGNIVGCIDADNEPVVFKIYQVCGEWVRGVNYFTNNDFIATLPALIPVELTEDILLLCGFKFEQRYNGRYYSKFRHFANGEYDGIDAYISTAFVKITKHDRFVDFFSNLHSFQNTYRSMTGKELEFNL
jgi:hypothetical protein